MTLRDCDSKTQNHPKMSQNFSITMFFEEPFYTPNNIVTGSVNPKSTHSPSPLGICQAFVILPVLAEGNLSETLCPGMGHLSILLEAVNVIPFSMFHLQIYLDSFRYRMSITNICNHYALKRYVWFSLHHFPILIVFLDPSKLTAIVISSHMEEYKSMYSFKSLKEKTLFLVHEWLRHKGLQKICKIFES